MKKVIVSIVTAIMMVCSLTAFSFAEDSVKAERTIMMYICGSDLESVTGMATYNLEQILKANYSKCDKVNFIVMTGGSQVWYLNTNKGDNYLCDPDGKAIEEIDPSYDQIWEVFGADEQNLKFRSKMVLREELPIEGEDWDDDEDWDDEDWDDDGDMDGDEDEPEVDDDGEEDDPEGDEEDDFPDDEDEYDGYMTNPETLKKFINYCAENYPADKYDLILWDHGNGPEHGFGADENGGGDMSFAGIIDALSDNEVIRGGKKFDFLDFDACLMGCVEFALGFADYADCYIASPESEPGFGQVYSGWLNALGNEKNSAQGPAMSAYEIGKMMVDDFTDFYNKDYANGTRQEGTLAAINTKELLNSSFVDDLATLNELLRSQADKEALFYDELRSGSDSIEYGDKGLNMVDLGNLTSMLGVAVIEGDGDTDDNVYTDMAASFSRLFSDKNIIYAKGTKYIKTDDERFYVDKNGNKRIGVLRTSGMYITFMTTNFPEGTMPYYKAVNEAADMMPAGDPRTRFLRDYCDTMLEYAMIKIAGASVSELVKEGVPKTEINYDQVKEYWLRSMYPDSEEDYMREVTMWEGGGEEVKVFVDALGGEETVKLWLDKVIQQQAEEAVKEDNVEIYEVKSPTGKKYQVRINDARRRAIRRIKNTLIPDQLPVAEQFLASGTEYAENVRKYLESYPEQKNFTLGSTTGTEYLSGKDYDDYKAYMNGTSSTWVLPSVEEKWYEVRDAQGKGHVAEVDVDGDLVDMYAVCPEDELGGEYDRLLVLEFNKGVLNEMYFMDDEGYRGISPSTLKDDILVTPIHYINVGFGKEFYLPISQSFTVNAQNWRSIKMEYKNANDIADISDSDHNGSKVTYRPEIEDIYYKVTDLSEKMKHIARTVIDINYAKVNATTYNGKVQSPKVTYNGKTLKKDVDYILGLQTADTKCKKAGTYKVFLEGIGDYTGRTQGIDFVIKKASNPFKIRGRKTTVSYKKLKRADKKLKVDRVIKTKKKGQGKKKYKRISGNPKIKINKKNGKVTVKKGLGKGTYRIRVKVKAKGNANYRASSWKKVTFRVVVQ